MFLLLTDDQVIARFDKNEIIYDIGTKMIPGGGVFIGELSDTISAPTTSDTSRMPLVPGIKRKFKFDAAKAKRSKTDREICQNEMAIFEDENVKQNFFQDWMVENQKNMANQVKVVEQIQILMSNEQMLRKKDQEIRQKDQEIIQKSLEAQTKTNNELLSMLKKVLEK